MTTERSWEWALGNIDSSNDHSYYVPYLLPPQFLRFSLLYKCSSLTSFKRCLDLLSLKPSAPSLWNRFIPRSRIGAIIPQTYVFSTGEAWALRGHSPMSARHAFVSSLDFYRRGCRREAHVPGLSHSHASDVVHRAAVIPLMERVHLPRSNRNQTCHDAIYAVVSACPLRGIKSVAFLQTP
jgi:hypothetical protein